MRFASRRSPAQHQMPRIGLCTMGVPFPNANCIRFIEESILSRWPSSQVGSSEWHSHQGTPLSTANGFRFRGVPSKRMGFACWAFPPLSRGFPSTSEWYSPQGTSPIHSEWDSLQGSLLQANGIRLLGVSPPFQGVPFSKWIIFTSRDFPYPQRMGFASGESPPPREWYSPQGDSLSTANGIRFKGFPLSIANWIRIICVTLSKRMGFAPRGSPSPERMGFASRGSPSPKRLGFAPKGLPLQANGIRIKRVALSKANGIRF